MRYLLAAAAFLFCLTGTPSGQAQMDRPPPSSWFLHEPQRLPGTPPRPPADGSITTHGNRSPGIKSDRDVHIYNCDAPGSCPRIEAPREGAPPAVPQYPLARSGMRWFPNQYVDGDGDLSPISEAARRVANRSECEARCLREPRCKAAEFYRPQSSCGLWSYVPDIKLGSNDSDVGIR
jgi:hypothetical protein